MPDMTSTPQLTRSAIGHRTEAEPERYNSEAVLGRWLSQMLDEVGYGTLLVMGEDTVVFANHMARTEMDGHHPLQIIGNHLRAQRPNDVAPLFAAIQDAKHRGLRRTLRIGAPKAGVCVAVLPVSTGALGIAPAAMLLLGKQQVCDDLQAQWFAQCHSLTATETTVLKALCAGTPPTQVAEEHRVAVSTVRTQISSIRHKTGAQSIRDLVRQVALMPPLVGVLRGPLQ